MCDKADNACHDRGSTAHTYKALATFEDALVGAIVEALPRRADQRPDWLLLQLLLLELLGLLEARVVARWLLSGHAHHHHQHKGNASQHHGQRFEQVCPSNALPHSHIE